MAEVSICLKGSTIAYMGATHASRGLAREGQHRVRSRLCLRLEVTESIVVAEGSIIDTDYWHVLEDGRVQCDVCPRACKLRDGQRGLCFVRGAEAGRIKLFSYGRSSGFCVDPIEKKPLNHFLPGTSVLSFGTAGCNLACKFCFHPDTLIATTRGMRRIADLFESCGEKISHDGGQVGFPASLKIWTRSASQAPVAKVFAHPYCGELLSLKANCCPPVLLTPNHKVFAAHRSNLQDIRPIEAAKLSIDHYLIIPKRQAGSGVRIDVVETLENLESAMHAVRMRRIPLPQLSAALQATGTSAELGVRQSTTFIVKFKRDRYEERKYRNSERTSWRDAGGKFLVPLRHIERVPYDGKVYNLEVEDPDHSYLAPFLAVSNCQNWDMSKSREMDTLADGASPEDLADAAERLGCASIAFTYNDPVVFMEYAIDAADACRTRGIKSVAVTAGYMCAKPRTEFYRHMDAANVDLKAFTESFYYKICGGALAPVLETLEYLNASDVWLEITTLLIPGENDSDAELDRLTRWVVEKLGPDVPLHFTAFHPDWKMRDKPPTSPATLTRARHIALANGLQYVYTGNVHDRKGGSTYCPQCGAGVIERDWYELGRWQLTDTGACKICGTQIPGVFAGRPGAWGARRVGVRLSAHS
jgi:pyruvate formate lyase activating enzyme